MLNSTNDISIFLAAGTSSFYWTLLCMEVNHSNEGWGQSEGGSCVGGRSRAFGAVALYRAEDPIVTKTLKEDCKN